MSKLNNIRKWSVIDEPLSRKVFDIVPIEDENGKLVNTYVLVDAAPREYLPAKAFDVDSILATGNTKLLDLKFSVPHDLNSIDSVLEASRRVASDIDSYTEYRRIQKELDDFETVQKPSTNPVDKNVSQPASQPDSSSA